MTENADSDTALPKNAVSTDEALREIQSLIDTQREEKRASRTGRGDVLLLIYVCAGLAIPMIAVQFFLAKHDADIAARYMQVIGLVLSAWGAFRAFVWKANAMQRYAKTAAWAYVLCFFAFSLVYGTLLAYSVSLNEYPFPTSRPMMKK